MYKFMEFPDSTEVTHSEMREDGSVKVCVERPVEGAFKTAYWELPSYRCFDVEGFGEEELAEQRWGRISSISGRTRTSRWNQFTYTFRKVSRHGIPRRSG